jgi:TRAP-type C4-dicarboxylate transport system substrate-binding protein
MILVSGAVAISSGCSGSHADKAGGHRGQKPVVLTLAFWGAPNSDQSTELEGLVRRVRLLSGGTVRIDVKRGWRSSQVNFEKGLINDVGAGKAELGVVGSRAWDVVGVTSLRALTAPLLIDSYTLQDRVVVSPMVAEMLKGLRPLGLTGVGVLPGPLRKPLGVLRPLVTPSDYAGLRIGVQESRVADATIRALGALPVRFAPEAAITGLDAIEQQIATIQANGYDRLGKYLTANVTLWPRPLVLFANRTAFAALTPAQRRILRKAVAADVAPETEVVRNEERIDSAILCRRGVRFLTANPADVAALRRAVRPVYASLERDLQTRRYIDQIEVMRAHLGSHAEPAPGCARVVRGPSGQPTPIDGVYRMTTKFGDEPADPTPVAENYGSWIFVFDRGRFVFTQEYKNACTWSYGTFDVSGHEMTWTFTDGGGIAPNNAANKPGEVFRFGWSIYRGTLTVTPITGAVSPLFYRGKPWRRISAMPSGRYLSKRCPPPARALAR